MASKAIVDEISNGARAPDPWCDESPESVLEELRGPQKPILLGLPCARCRLYYDAKLDACPRCGCTERVRPAEVPVVTRRAA